MRALYALWERQSSLGLFGNHINVLTGKWTAMDAGIGGCTQREREGGRGGPTDELVRQVPVGPAILLAMSWTGFRSTDAERYLAADLWRCLMFKSPEHVIVAVLLSPH